MSLIVEIGEVSITQEKINNGPNQEYSVKHINSVRLEDSSVWIRIALIVAAIFTVPIIIAFVMDLFLPNHTPGKIGIFIGVLIAIFSVLYVVIENYINNNTIISLIINSGGVDIYFISCKNNSDADRSAITSIANAIHRAITIS